MNSDVVSILKLLKFNTIGAEIGVWKGQSSKLFCNSLNPQKLYLVDPWHSDGYHGSDQEVMEFMQRHKKWAGGDTKQAYNSYYDSLYQRVKKQFKDNPVVEVCRMNSTDWFNSFNGELLDWIYIDGDHSYEGVKNDLNNCLNVLKPNAVIIGDDYLWTKDVDKGGVKRAVNEFIEQTGYKLVQHGVRQFQIIR